MARRPRSRGTCRRSRRAPSTECLHKVLLELGRERLVVEVTRHCDRGSHLLEVAIAPVAENEVLLDALAVRGSEHILEIGRHELDDLDAGKFSVQPHPRYSSRAL